MSLMKFINNPDSAVHDALCGLKCAYPSLSVDPENRIVISNEIVENQVCILSGGGSGHEPFAAGYVGKGMLSGAVAGFVFASPPVHSIFSAIRTLSEANRNSGVLLIVLNYTGDVLNFGWALEKARAHNIEVELVIVGDDCSRLGDDVQGAGRRGECGTCFVIKIAGAMAESGKSLKEISAECRKISENVATIATAVTPCSIPGTGPLFHMDDDEIDIGLGIHGEAGISRTKLKPVTEILEIMTTQLLKALNMTSTTEACVMVSNFGSVSQLEMSGICYHIRVILDARDVAVSRLYNGTYLSSLDMAGFQYCILNTATNPQWLQYLDEPTHAPGWNGTCHSIPLPHCKDPIIVSVEDDERPNDNPGPQFSQTEKSIFERCLIKVAEEIIRAERRLNELDSKTGDGDCGATLRRLAEAILGDIEKMDLKYPAVCFHHIANLSQRAMGGASGALYGILLTSAAKFLYSTDTIDWAALWKSSLNTLSIYSKAKVGDRTMLDALIPACEEFDKRANRKENLIEAFAAAVTVARKNCEKTKFMKAKMGRASYVPSEYITDVDPGAFGVTIWLEAILSILQQSWNKFRIEVYNVTALRLDKNNGTSSIGTDNRNLAFAFYPSKVLGIFTRRGLRNVRTILQRKSSWLIVT